MYLPKSDDCINSVRCKDKDGATCPLECGLFEQIQTCETCGCKGNMSCGHEPLNDYHGCALDQSLVCACCVEKAGE